MKKDRKKRKLRADKYRSDWLLSFQRYYFKKFSEREDVLTRPGVLGRGIYFLPHVYAKNCTEAFSVLPYINVFLKEGNWCGKRM